MTNYEEWKRIESDPDNLIINRGYSDCDLIYSVSRLTRELQRSGYDEKHIAYIISGLYTIAEQQNKKLPPYYKFI